MKTGRNKRIAQGGYTLSELAVTAIIVGTLAAVAIPSMGSTIDRMRSQEATQILYSLFGAQQDYRRDTGNYHTGNVSAIYNDLHIAIDTTILGKHFKNLQTVNQAFCSQTAVARVDNKDDKYTLAVLTDGTIACRSGSTCGSDTCQKIGH